MRRDIARPGLSIVDANGGRLITIEDDVLGVKKQIEETFGLSVVFDTVDEVWVVVQTDLNGVERFVLETQCLDQRLLDRLHAADQHRSDYDPEKEADDWNKKLEKQRSDELEERLAEMVDKLRYAFKRDGLYNHCSITHKPVGQTVDQRRVITSRNI